MASSLYNKISRIQQLKNTYIKAGNLKPGVNVFGVNGTFTSDANANGNDLALGKTAYVNGTRIGGSLAVYDATTRNIPWGSINDDKANQCLRINYSNTTNLNTRPNYHTNCGNAAIYNGAYMEIGYTNLANKIGLDPLTLKKDVTVLGVTGQYDASTEFSGIKMDPVVASNTALSLTSSITEVSGLDMTQGTNLAYYFNSLQGLTSLTNISAPNVTNLYSFCNYDYKLSKIEYVNFYNEEQTAVNCSYMFNYCNNLRSIPNTVIFPKSIQCTWYMFTNCSQLTDINTPLNIANTNVASLFVNCQSLVNISNITIPNTSKAITSSMFANCFELDVANTNLKGLILQNSSGSMLSNTRKSTRANLQKFFANINSAWVNGGLLIRTAIEEVDCDLWSDIPQFQYTNNLYNAFSYCNNITKVNFYKNKYDNLNSCFYSCINLTEASITSPNCVFGGMTNVFWGCTNLTDVNLDMPSQVTGMNNTFYGCTNLVNINFNNSFTQTGTVALERSFQNAANLVYFKANIPKGVSNLCQTFFNCTNLKEVTFNSNTKWCDTMTYAWQTFYNCSNLQTIDNVRDINLHITSGSGSGMFYRCSNLNINSIDFNITREGAIDACNFVISDNPFIQAINITFNGYFSNPYYGLNMNTLVSNCSNIKAVNINLIDRSTNSNTLYLTEFIRNCPNIQTLNFDLFMNGNRAMYGNPISNCNIDTLNYKVSREVSKTSSANVSIYSSSINNLNVQVDSMNAYMYYSYCNINNYNLTLTNVQQIASYGFYHSTLKNSIVDLNYPAIQKLGHIYFQNISGVTDFKVNFKNAVNLNTSMQIMVQDCKDLEYVDMDLSNLQQTQYLNIQNCTNIKGINVNFANLTNTGYSVKLNNLGVNCTDINLYMPNLKIMNYSFDVFNNPGLVNLNLNIGKSLTNIYDFRFTNLPNLVNINMDYPNIQNVYVSAYVIFNNCPKMSDETIDNLFGMLSNCSRVGTKYINYSFRNCNLSQERAQNLANYNNLISAGWTY